MQISKRTIVVVFKSRNEYTSIQSWNKEQPNHHRISNTSDTLKQSDENVEEKQKVGKVMVNFPEKENKIMHIYIKQCEKSTLLVCMSFVYNFWTNLDYI